MEASSKTWRVWTGGLLLCLVVAGVFSPALKGTFIWDDNALIVTNPHVHGLTHWKQAWSRGFGQVAATEARPTETNFYYRPLVTLSFMADYALWDGDPRGFHLTNLLLHALACALVFALGWWIFQGRWGPTFVMAFCFALHPSRAESVSWISGRTDVLMSVFCLGALALFGRALTARRRSWAWGAGGWLLWGAALLCKETALLLVAILPAVDWLWLHPGQRSLFWRHARWFFAPLGLAALAFVGLRLWFQGSVFSVAGTLPVAQWLGLVLQSLGHYVELVLIPFEPNMQVGALYVPAQPHWGTLILGGAALLAWTGCLLWSWRRQTAVALGLLFFGAFMLPATNVVPLNLSSLVAERFLYFPWLGGAFLLALGQQAVARGKWRWPYLGLLAVLLLPWAVTTHLRSKDFQDPLRFWRAEVAASPQNPLAKMKLARVWERRGHPEPAAKLWAESVGGWQRSGRHPGFLLHALLGLVKNHLDGPAAADRAQLAASFSFLTQLLERMDPPPPFWAPTGATPKHRGPTISSGGRPTRSTPASARLGDRQISLDVRTPPMQDALQQNRARIWALWGDAASRLGEREAQAVAALEASLQVRPQNPRVWLRLTFARARARKLTLARQALAQVERLRPQAPQVPWARQRLADMERILGALHGQGTSGQGTSGQGTSGQGTSGQGTSGQGTSGQGTSGQGTSGGDASPLDGGDPRTHRLWGQFFLAGEAPLRALPHLQKAARLSGGPVEQGI